MEEIPLIHEFLVTFALAVVVLLLCYRLRIPNVVALLLTGVMSGPYGFAFVKGVEDVQAFANLGIILLLFTVGMEISLKKILQMWRLFFIGGSLQIGLTILGTFSLAVLLGFSKEEGVLLGCLLALSSTAVVLRMLTQKGESDTPHGRGALALLIFQDFCAVPMMLMIPFLGNDNIVFDTGLVWSFAKGIALLSLTFVAAWHIVPGLLYYAARTRIRELFLLTVISVCLGVAWISQLAGLSLALGAFLAGLVISQSDFSHEAMSDIIPFQDLFTSFFFITVGMLLDIRFATEHVFLIFTLALLSIGIKAVAATFAGVGAGLSLRSAAWMGISLAQISEFSFVLAHEGVDAGVVSTFEYQIFLAVAILTIALTPGMIQWAPLWANLWDAIPIPERFKNMYHAIQPIAEKELKDHVVIIGFGLAGRTLAQSCKQAEIPYAIVEMNAQTVRKERVKGEPIHYGDASHEAVLEHVHLHQAKVAAVVINDAAAAMRVVKKIKHTHPSIYLVVRTHYLQDVKTLYALGADQVISDEYGSAIEVFSCVLNNYSVSEDAIQKLVTSLAVHLTKPETMPISYEKLS